MRYCSLAIDIGASSGKLIAGFLEKGEIKLNDIYQFDNQMVEKNNHFCWDLEKIFQEIQKGVLLCKKKGLIPKSIGIDTWAVDFVLLDKNDELLTDAVAYRDSRTDGIMEEVSKFISKETLYYKTGIQFQKFNTIYQLYWLKKHQPDILKQAKTFLMIPDYLNFLLTGNKTNEYTNASSTQLLNVFTNEWDQGLLDLLGINSKMFQEILLPKSRVGSLRQDLVQRFGFDMDVILPATHDTGSAVVAIPEVKETIYISSGTWSLIGVENDYPICTEKSFHYNFTNEGGIDYRFRFLKNIMGLWIIQEVKKNYNNQYSFTKLAELAALETKFHSTVDVNNNRFLNPENMIREIKEYCAETQQEIPKTPAQIAKCIYSSLAISYKKTIKQIEEICGKKFNKINVIGGGSQNKFLNKLIADTTKKEVLAGPTEATTIGNLASQLLAVGKIKDLQEARDIIKYSFKVEKYKSETIS